MELRKFLLALARAVSSAKGKAGASSRTPRAGSGARLAVDYFRDEFTLVLLCALEKSRNIGGLRADNIRAHVSEPTTPAALFEHELEVFRTEAEAAVQFFCYEFAINDSARENEGVLALLNEAALFWKTICGALQTAGFVTLGRIFDQDSTHNLDKLLRLAEDHREIFSKAALAGRRQGRNTPAPEWLDEYVQSVYEPETSDFRLLRKQIAEKRRTFESNYKEIRRQFFAHKAISKPEQIAELFGRTNVDELKQLLAFLLSVHEALWQLFNNGRRPDIATTMGTNKLAERVKAEAKNFLILSAAHRNHRL
jgi:hypothetical protein